MQPRPISVRGLRPSRASWLSGLPLLGVLLALAAAPARATITVSTSLGNSPYTVSATMNSSVTDNIVVKSDGELDITGGSVTVTSGIAVVVDGGTLVMSGGTISGGDYSVYVNGGTVSIADGALSAYQGVRVDGGTVSISRGTISGPGFGGTAMRVYGGMVSISGGAVSGNYMGVFVGGGKVSISGGTIYGGDKAGVYCGGTGTVSISGGSISGKSDGLFFVGGTFSIFGCGLRLSGGYLTGALEDGTPINTPFYGLSASNLIRTCPDTSAPTTTATATADGNPYASGTWTNTRQGVTVSLSATDPDGTSDVKQITHRASGAQTTPITTVPGASATPPTITAEGITTVAFFASDMAGNVESPGGTFTVQIDNTAPQTTATPSGTTGNNGWYTSPVSVTLAATDANGSLAVSGVKQTLYSLDGAGFKDYALLNGSPVAISGNGPHTLAFYSIDGAGNFEDQTNPSNTLTVKIDTTPPTTSANLSGRAGNNGWYRSAVSVSLSATDAASGVASTSYGLDGGATQTYTGAIAVSGDGTHTLTFASTDNAGNVEATRSVAVMIDTTAPALSIGAADGNWHANDVSISVTASDATSGLANPADASFSLTTSVPAGTETSSAATNTYTVFDQAGNSAAAGPVTGIKVDKKAPTITISTPTAGAIYFLHQAVAASYSVTDGGSGVNPRPSGGPVASGSNIDTASAGSKTFTVTGVDNVGNTATPRSVSYAVGYKIVALYDQTST